MAVWKAEHWVVRRAARRVDWMVGPMAGHWAGDLVGRWVDWMEQHWAD